MKKTILLCLILTLLIITMTSCPFLDINFENGNHHPVEIVHNPKNLLFVEQSDNSFNKIDVFMRFTTPADFGATSYTLQFSPSNSPYVFETMMNGAEAYTTTTPNAGGYTVVLPSSHTTGYFRLLITGGAYDGEYSNIEYATQCAIDADVSWGLDPSMFNTGIAWPHVGFGIVAEFPLFQVDGDGDPSNDVAINDGLTYEWYRMNPNDYEDKELIVGQTDLSYTTQTADIDHLILIVATGTTEKFLRGLCRTKTDFVVEP